MTKINISSLIEDRTRNDSRLKNIILNINLKVSKILSNLLFCLIFISLITWMLAALIIIQQLQDLQIQMQSLTLMCQDNESNHVDASIRFHRSVDHNDFVSSIIPSTLKLSNQMEVRDDRNFDTIMLESYNQIVSDRSADHENNTIKRNANGSLDTARSLSNLMINLFFDSNNRQNLRPEMQNYTAESETSNDYGLIKWSESRARRLRRNEKDSEEQRKGEKGGTRRQSEEEENEKQRQREEESDKRRQSEKKEETRRQNEEIRETRRQSKDIGERHQQSEEENEKRRQSEGNNKTRQSERKRENQRNSEEKGEKRRQNRRERNRKRLGPLVATFVGAVPELTNTVYIGPWVKRNVDHHYDFTKFHLVEDKMSIQVGISGLYMISVQIYFAHPMNHCYSILLNPEGSSARQKLVTCAASSTNEVSCYTSVITYLRIGDRLSLQQQEKNRLINLQEGHSQIQITLLASDRRRST